MFIFIKPDDTKTYSDTSPIDSGDTDTMLNSTLQPNTNSLSQGEIQVIHSVIDAFCQHRRLFTAWDITKFLIAASTLQPMPRHHLVKECVHNYYTQGNMLNYDRDTVRLPVVAIPPFVYFPDDLNAYDYLNIYNSNPNSLSAPFSNSTPTPTPQPMIYTPPKASKPSNGPNSVYGASANKLHVNRAGETTADKLGRIILPKNALSQIGVSPRSQIWVQKEADGSLVVSSGDTLSNGKPLQVDCYGNVKVRLGTEGDTFIISGDGSKLVISPK